MQMEGDPVQNTQSEAVSASESDSKSLLSLAFMDKVVAPGGVSWPPSQGRRRRKRRREPAW